MTPTRTGMVAVVADDLIWATRLMDAVTRAGGTPARMSTQTQLDTALDADAMAELGPDDADKAVVGVIVDLFGKRFDGIAAVERAKAANKPVIAVAQHDDLVTRKRALAAGASRVFSYNKFFSDGPRLVQGWLARGGS